MVQVYSELAVGRLQRHWLKERLTDDYPRCGWRGYFDHQIAAIDEDCSSAFCDGCYADLHPEVAVTYYSARLPSAKPAVAAIRQRPRSDHN